MPGVRMTKALATLLLVILSAGPEAQSARGQRWSKLDDLAPGTQIHVTTTAVSFPALVVRAEPDLLTVVDLSKVHDENMRKEFASQVPGRRTRLVTDGFLEWRGTRAEVLRISREEVRLVTTTTTGSPGTVALATAGAAVGGLFAGAAAGIAASGGLFSTEHETRGAVVFLSISVGLPVAVGLGVHSATRGGRTKILYEATTQVDVPLGPTDWEAVRQSLPESLRRR